MRSKIITVVSWILTPFFPIIWLVQKMADVLIWWHEQIVRWIEELTDDV